MSATTWLACFALWGAAPRISARPDPGLHATLERVIRGVPATVGVAVRHLGTGASAQLHGNEPFPMQSVFKLPLAIAVLRAVQDGELALEPEILIASSERAPGYSPLAERIGPKGLPLTLDELVEYAVGQSDNTAADVLLARAGGPRRVMATLRRLGVEGVRIDRSERELWCATSGVERPDCPRLGLDEMARAERQVPERRRLEATLRYLEDPRDRATPEAMLRLLEALQAGQLLGAANTRKLMSILEGSPTGPRRLRAGLPSGTPLAHKTGLGSAVGALAPVVNDVGLITLPGGERVGVAVFVRAGKGRVETFEAQIAHLSRATWEHFTQGPGVPDGGG